LDRRYTLQLQVRDTLINAFVDGQRVLAWRTPLARRDGHLQITTFDARATIERVVIKSLDPQTELQEARGHQPDPQTARGAAWHLAKAEAEVVVAESKVTLAQAHLHSVEQRGRATEQRDRVDAAEQAGLIAAAVLAERKAETAAARVALAQAELNLVLGGPSPGDDLSAAKNMAAEAVAQAQAKEADTSGEYTRLVAARWSPTRFKFSGHDDPTVTFPPTSSGRRSALAAWITDPRHPLTARVAVNHLWNRHFGRPLVESVFDFGRNGTPPSHPELLDWLACELIDSGWSMKHLHRLILQSATYRLATLGPEELAAENLQIDPDNQAYWQRTSGRMESQVVRDALLELAGELDVALGGPPVPAAQQAASKRRSLYFFHSNNDRNLFLTMFDEASVAECYRREQSVVPQQALALANSELVDQVVPRVAQRLGDGMDPATESAEDATFVDHAFLVLLGRPSTAEERRLSLAALRQWRQEFEAAAAEGDSASDGQPPALAGPAAIRQRWREPLIWVLLNHNDFLTIH
jgi:hypothetical protein